MDWPRSFPRLCYPDTPVPRQPWPWVSTPCRPFHIPNPSLPALSSKTLLNHCNAAFFSASRSSDVME